jgi:hypothetical protein
MGQYVIYARKSTESEDRQVLSIDSQVRELRQLATKHDVQVGEVLTESRSGQRSSMRRLRSFSFIGSACGVTFEPWPRCLEEHVETKLGDETTKEEEDEGVGGQL